jgi:hypothetical protein
VIVGANKGLNGAVVAISAGGVALTLPGGGLRVLSVFVSGGPVTVRDLPPLPSRERIIAVDAVGPSVVTEDGSWWTIGPTETTWRRVANVLDDEAVLQ